jgi:hypothetical protein
MIRVLVSVVSLALVSCATSSFERKPVVIIADQKCCAKHRIPLISVRGFGASEGTLVHMDHPRVAICDERAPNRIWDSRRLYRTDLHHRRATVTFCPHCEAEFWECLGGDRKLSETDIREITLLLSRRSDIRKPVLRIVPDAANHALVDCGEEDRVDAVFNEIAVAKRNDRWVITSPIAKHVVIARGLVRW